MSTSLWKEIPFRYPNLLRFFEEISAIPRESYHEEQIADYLVAFARERGLPYYRDTLHNVFIEKPGTAGYENHPALLLQGHTDMVCEKNAGVTHDFSTDPLDLYVEDGWLRARGTTLGADDGVALAIMLAVLDGEIAEHPPIQCLFSSAEEVGMGGIEGFDFSRVTARSMINLDSPDDLQIIAGCAGGMYSTLCIRTDSIPCENSLLRISIKGLAGGHSGEDIHRNRANANVLLARVLTAVTHATPLSLVSFDGGNKKNAIPREAVAVIAVKDVTAATATINTWRALLRTELVADDTDFSLISEPIMADAPRAMSIADTERVLIGITKIPYGVLVYNRTLGDSVELSCNLGMVKTKHEGEQISVEISALARSSETERLMVIEAELGLLARMIGASIERENFYGGWAYAEKSTIREAFSASCEAIAKQTPSVTVIHAGLECGTIKREIPDMDIISCGPQVRGLHSPDEALRLASFEQFFAIMEHLLKSL